MGNRLGIQTGCPTFILALSDYSTSDGWESMLVESNAFFFGRILLQKFTFINTLVTALSLIKTLLTYSSKAMIGVEKVNFLSKELSLKY